MWTLDGLTGVVFPCDRHDGKDDEIVRTLRKLASYNAWANQVMFETIGGAPPELLEASAKGSYGSIEETVKHLVSVENAYLAMLQGRDPEAVLGPAGEYYGHDLTWFAERSRQLGDAYEALLQGKDESWLESTFQVPWMDHPMTRRDGLLQVFTHSSLHRAQVLSELGASGMEVPDVDYNMIAARLNA